MAAANTGTTAPSASTLWPALTGSLSTTPDPTSPTGGYVDVNTNVGTGISTDANSLLPGGFSQSQLGVPQQSTATASPQSYVTAGESQMQGPVNWNVTSDQTVAGQYANLMGEGGSPISPAVQAAEQATIRSNAAHGGGNDLMTQNAAAMSGSQVALTVAAQDAQTNAAAAQYNATAANTYNQNLNQFVENAQLSSQNFNEGLATLNAQTNQQLDLMTANVNADAATTSISLNASLAQTQASLNASLAQMGQQYNYTTATNFQNAGIANAQAWTQYGQQVRLGYLSSVNSQANSLQQEIANISSNPNITSAQAQGAMSDAVNEFNTLVSTLGSYSAAMMPSSSTGTPSGTYNSPSYNYSYIDSASFPGPSTGGGSSSNGFFLNPSSLSSGGTTGGVAPINNPFQTQPAASTGGSGGGSGGNGGANTAGSYSGNSAGGLVAGATGSIQGNNFMYNGQSIANVSEAQSMVTGLQSEISQQTQGQSPAQAIVTAASALNNFINQSPTAKLLAMALGLLIPGVSIVTTLSKAIGWLGGKLGYSTTGNSQGDINGGNTSGAQAYNGNNTNGAAPQDNGNGSIQPLGGPNIFEDIPSDSAQGQAAQQDNNAGSIAGELDGGNFNDGSGSTWDGSMEGGGDFSGGGDYGGGGGGGGHIPGQLGGDASIE